MANNKKSGKIRKFGRRFLNPSAWMGKEQIVNTGKAIKDNAKDIFTVKDNAVVQESFADAMLRLNMSEQDVLNRQYSLKKLYIIFAMLSLSIFGYFIYNLINFYWIASLMSLGLAAALLGFAFKYHFWYFQLRERRLGCTLEEWWHVGILGKRLHRKKMLDK